MSRGLFFYNDGEEENHRNEQDHILESCYLCSRPFMSDSDIFMYRGNIPFCSDDCRQEQIEFDEARERKKKMSMRAKSADSDQPTSSSSDIQQAGSIEVA